MKIKASWPWGNVSEMRHQNVSKEGISSWQLKSLDPFLQSKYRSWRNAFPTANSKWQENETIKHKNKAHPPFLKPQRRGPMETWPRRSASPLWARGHCCHPSLHSLGTSIISVPSGHPQQRSSALPHSPGSPRAGTTHTASPSPCQQSMGKPQRCLQLQELVKSLAWTHGSELVWEEGSWGGNHISSELQQGGLFLWCCTEMCCAASSCCSCCQQANHNEMMSHRSRTGQNKLAAHSSSCLGV